MANGKSNLTISPDGKQAWSYGTQIFATVKYPSDPSRTRTITLGNVTQYSSTTSNHQVKAGAWGADILLVRVPRGTSDLGAWFFGMPEGQRITHTCATLSEARKRR